MSIIYDALQKTQKKLENKTDVQAESVPKKNVRQRLIRIEIKSFLMAAFISILFFIIFIRSITYTPHHATPKMSVTSAKKIAVSRNPLVLNGVFLSTQEKMAFINHQAFHLGDTVEGMRLVKIDLEKVTLKKGAETFELQLKKEE